MSQGVGTSIESLTAVLHSCLFRPVYLLSLALIVISNTAHDRRKLVEGFTINHFKLLTVNKSVQAGRSAQQSNVSSWSPECSFCNIWTFRLKSFKV